MKLFKTTLCAAVATLAMTGAASAADFSFNLGVATDYVFRGVDQTAGFSEGQLFGGADVAFDGGFYAGTWVSNTGPDVDNGIEYDLYAGWKPSAMGVSFDLGALYYGYNNSEFGFVSNNSDTLEFKLAASVPAGPVTLGAAVYYSPDLASSDESSVYYEVSAGYTFANKATVSAAYGIYDSDAFLALGAGTADKYATWNVGVSYPITDNFSIDARYIGADSDASSIYGAGGVGDGFVGTLKATF